MKRGIVGLLILVAILVIGLSGTGSQTGGVIERSLDSIYGAPGFIYELIFGPGMPDPNRQTIRIATWNVENWGKAKTTDPQRMGKIAEVLSHYDVVAVQEISNIKEQKDPDCPRNQDCPGNPSCGLIGSALEEYLNEGLGLNYSFVFSPQVRDERYLFVYDQEKVELLGSDLVEDPGDSEPICDASPESTGLMVRQPFAGSFRAGDFDFTLLNVHTSPGINLQELKGLERLYSDILEMEEPDVIVLGDLNADCDYLGPKDRVALRDEGYIWVVDDEADTTVGSSDCAYDRLVFTEPTMEDYAGSWGVEMGIPRDVSDHYPVWADFYIDGDTA